MGAWRAALAGIALLAACEAPLPDEEPKPPEYLGIETRKLDDDLVSFLVQMNSTSTITFQNSVLNSKAFFTWF